MFIKPLRHRIRLFLISCIRKGYGVCKYRFYINLHILYSCQLFPRSLHTVLRDSRNHVVVTRTQLHPTHGSRVLTSPIWKLQYICLLTVAMLAELCGTTSTVFNLQVLYISVRRQVHLARKQDHRPVHLI
jgi:hypothetical protein